MEMTPDSGEISFTVEDESHVGAARRSGSALARSAGLSDTDTGRAAIVINELTTNLLRHAGGGRIMIRALRDAVPGIEVLTIDRGPGIRNVREAFRDGHSTGGTAGTGLGAVRRLAEFSDLYTAPGSGTAVLARVAGKGTPSPSRVAVGAAAHPVEGEHENGDGWAVATTDDRTALLLVDGLGHGTAARAAAAVALRTFRANPWRAPSEMLHALDGALRPTRGGAVAVGLIEHNLGRVRYVGCGNIAGVIVSPVQTKNLVSHNGTAGHACRRFTEFTYEWSPESLLVMHSDGLHNGWKLEAYPGLVERHPSLIAGILMRDFERGRDDTSVLVVREKDA